jgi:hypothetical protein
MEIKKVNLDRTKLTSAYIQDKQDFNKVLKEAKLTKTPTFNSPWFYGAVGLSSVAVATLFLSDFDKQPELNEKTTTQLSTQQEEGKERIVLATAMPVREITSNIADQKKNSPNHVVSDKKKLNTQKSVIEIVNDVSKESIEEKSVVKHRSEFPTINGLSSGKLTVFDFLSAEEIEISEEFRIVSYKVQYFNGNTDLSVQMSGAALPKNIREQITQFNLGQMVFFTEIKGLNSDGKLKLLPSMNFKIVAN